MELPSLAALAVREGPCRSHQAVTNLNQGRRLQIMFTVKRHMQVQFLSSGTLCVTLTRLSRYGPPSGRPSCTA